MNLAAPSTDVSYYTDQLGTGALVAIIVLSVAVWVVFLVAYVQIIRKAGYSGWWILIMLVPLVNVIMLLVFAFKEWPIQREIRELRAWAGQVQRGGQPAAGYGASSAGRAGYGPSGFGPTGQGSSGYGQSGYGSGSAYPGPAPGAPDGGPSQGGTWGTGPGEKR